MSISSISSSDIGFPRVRRALRKNVASVFPAIVLLLCTSLLVALEPPSKPFLDKNSFYLSSAGFKVHFANDPAGEASAARAAAAPHCRS